MSQSMILLKKPQKIRRMSIHTFVGTAPRTSLRWIGCISVVDVKWRDTAVRIVRIMTGKNMETGA